MVEEKHEHPALFLPALSETENEAVQGFVDASTRLYSAMENSLVQQHNLTLMDVLLLQHLVTSGNSASMGDLAESLALIPSRVSQQVGRLERRALVQRVGGADDRRRVMATITRKGHAQTRAAMITYAQMIRTAFLDPLRRRQLLTLSDSCRRIAERLNGHR